MRKLYILIGKSASGKDSIYKNLLKDPELHLKPYIGYTTRPIRTGEQNGREYYFVTKQQMKESEAAGLVIEKRVYHTVHGDWWYFSMDQNSLDPDAAKRDDTAREQNSQEYLYIGTLESYPPLRDYYGADVVTALYIQVDDGLRLQRALDRERAQTSPKYAEMCRRYLGDEQDFSEEKLQAAGIERRFENDQFARCLQELKDYIRERGG